MNNSIQSMVFKFWTLHWTNWDLPRMNFRFIGIPNQLWMANTHVASANAIGHPWFFESDDQTNGLDRRGNSFLNAFRSHCIEPFTNHVRRSWGSSTCDANCTTCGKQSLCDTFFLLPKAIDVKSCSIQGLAATDLTWAAGYPSWYQKGS